MPTPSLSLIVPAFRSADFIVANIQAIIGTLEQRDRAFELLVVCDGAVDQAGSKVAALGDDRVKVIEYPENQGKGFAICVGIAFAQNRLIGWLDADLDIKPDVILAAEDELVTRELDAVVGSKRHPDSSVSYPLVRRVLSIGYQALVQGALGVRVRDTQSGAKVFRREMLDTVVPLLLIKRYAFDLEVLTVGALFGFDRIGETPIDLQYRFTGSGINSQAVRRMFVDTLALAYRVRLQHWYVRQFAAVQRLRAEARDEDKALPVIPASNMALFETVLPDNPFVAVSSGADR